MQRCPPVSLPLDPQASPNLRQAADVVIDVQARQRQGRDCTPYNGPFGFYGNIWCQPPSETSYLRNLSSPWPMNTPPSLKKKRPANGGTEW